MSFEDLKVGDRVYRMMGGRDKPWMEMEVMEIKDNLLVCGAIVQDGGKELVVFKGGWTFDRNSGLEEDDDLQWGLKYGKTGSYLKRRKDKPDAI